jgi:DNA-binding transcriptional LysR family regulator
MLYLNEMMIFATVVSEGSFTKAAGALGLQKTNVSRKVQMLEKNLRVQLLERTTRSLKLTDLGEIYYYHCQRILKEVEMASQSISQQLPNPTGTIKISAPIAFGPLVLSDMLCEFQTRYPEVKVDVFLVDRTVDPISEGMDVSINAQPGSQECISKALGPSHRIVCASPDYIGKFGMPSTPGDIENHKAIVYSTWDDSQLWTFRKDGEDTIVSLNGSFSINDIATVHKTVLSGLGVAVMPVLQVKDDLRAKKLVPLLTEWSLRPNSFYMVYKHTNYGLPKVQAFVDFMKAACNPRAPWSIEPSEALRDKADL